MSLRVVAHLTARLDTIEETKALLMGLITPTRQEAGCLEYVLVRNDADPSDLTFIEEWESDAALDAHLKSPHLTVALEKFATLLAGPPDIRRYRVVA